MNDLDSPLDAAAPRSALARQARLEAIFGWVTVASAGLLLASGAFDALSRGLPSRWGQAAAATIFVLAQVGTIGRDRSPLARALASLLYVGAILEAYWFSWGSEDGTVFAWSNLTLEAVRDGLLLWALGLGALVLALAPPRATTRLLGAILGLFLMLPWIWGLSRGSSRLQIIEGPDWLAWGWYVQPAFIGLAILVPVAVVALLETAYKVGLMGAMEHGVLVGLGLLSAAPIGLIALHQFAPELVQPAPDIVIDFSGEEHGGSADHHHHHGPGEEHHRDIRPLETLDETLPGSDLFECEGVVQPEADILDLKAAFTPETWRQTALSVLERRFPDGAWLVDSLKDPAHFEQGFPSPPTSWRSMMLGMSTALHETVRLVGFQQLSDETYTYPVGSDQILTVSRPTLFPRSEILDSLPLPVRELRQTRVHLRGEAGTRSLEAILDQLNASSWSLYTEVALLDQTVGRRVSARDAVLASLAYTDAYLSQGRNHQPDDYLKLRESEALRAATVLLWDRAVCVLQLSGTDPRLGLEDVAIFPVVFRPDSYPEVNRLRPEENPAPSSESPTEAEHGAAGTPPELNAPALDNEAPADPAHPPEHQGAGETAPQGAPPEAPEGAAPESEPEPTPTPPTPEDQGAPKTR